MHKGQHYFHNPDYLFIEGRFEDLFIRKAEDIHLFVNQRNQYEGAMPQQCIIGNGMEQRFTY